MKYLVYQLQETLLKTVHHCMYTANLETKNHNGQMYLSDQTFNCYTGLTSKIYLQAHVDYD